MERGESQHFRRDEVFEMLTGRNSESSKATIDFSSCCLIMSKPIMFDISDHASHPALVNILPEKNLDENKDLSKE